MAGGNNNKTKEEGILVQARLNQSLRCCNRIHRECKVIKNKNVKNQILQQSKLLYQRHVDLLQEDIEKIFNESLHCDLKLIHGCKVVYTHQCIIRSRSPWFYNVLRPYISFKNNTAHCYIKQLGIYQQFKNFVRLLYTNSDISHYERFLIQLLVNTTCPVFEHTCESSQREFIRNKAFNYYMNCCSYGNVIEKGVNDKSPTSDMADSGVESGSVVSPHETISENSSTDLDEPNESSSKNHEISRTRGSSILNERNHNRSDSSREQVSDEYESRVLGDPYYESVDESDDEQANSYLPTASFKYPEQNSSFLSSANVKKHDDKITQNGRKPNITIEQHIDINTSSSNSNYYFIDASSLNDDIDVATTNVVGYPNDLNGRLNWSNPPMPNSCYIPTSRSNNFFRNDDTYKLPNRTSVNAQNRYEEVQYNQDSDYSETFSDSQKLQKFESLAIQDDLNSCKSNNKESLVVEIKEADSGESAQHSPCPDNTKVDNIQKVQDRLVNIEPEQQESEEQDEEPESKPVLIRRNTFELDANDEKLSSLRQEYERRQGSLVFQNSITQYSQHRIDGDPFYDPAIEPDSFANNLDINTNSEIAIDAPKDFVSDKYDLDSSEKENKSCRLLSNVDNESAIHSISRSASDKWLANCETDEDDISFNSLPVHINNDFSMSQVRSKLRRNEAAPIVSGGASSSDFQKPTDSPIVKRKTESTPIVSGGSVIIPEPDIKEKSKVKSSNMSSSMTAWVVDISDCRTSSIEKKVKQPQVSMSSSFSHMTSADKWGTEKDKEKDKQPSSLGYFVNLDDIKSPNENSKEGINKHRRRPSDSVTSEKNYCEFFIDISDNKPARRRSIDKSIEKSNDKMVNKKIESLVSPLATRVSMTSSQPSDSKKNIFSMFIDLNDPKLKPKSKTESEEMPRASSVTKSSSSSKLSDKQRFEPTECGVTEDQSNEERKPKSGVFMFIESDSPLVRRRTLSSSRPAFKRHSWNTDKSQEQQSPTTVNEQQTTIVPKRVHKRAHSLSVDRVGDFRKFITCRSSNSSHSLNEAANKVDLNGQQALPEQKEQSVIQEQKSEQKDETYDYDIRDTPPNSHVEILNEELLVSLKNRNYQELDSINEHTAKETNEANDTKTKTKPDDCYSESSVWEKTPTEESTETNERRKSETFDITISSSASGPSSTSDNLDYKLAELLDPTQQKSTMNLKSAKNHQDNKLNLQNHEKVKSNSAKSTMPASFVRLSDLDKRPLSTSATGIITAKSYENSYRLSNSVTETSWIESKLVGSARTNEPLHKTLNKRLSLSIATGAIKSENYDEFNTEGDAEAVISESDLSSLRSSMGRSAEGSTEETETSSFAMGKPYNRLGEDLLRMFLEEINPDVTIDVGGRRIKAHKCILSSRCQYFAAILSGGWIESAGNIISLQGYSYNAVHFALCHIYSGESCIPDTISIVELATLADMLCLEGLKEVIGFTLKVKYCHLFHKPCNGCAVGVLECMPLAAAYGLDEVYRKSLRWVTRHFVRIWPTKEFATLPRELMDKCYHQHIVYMCADNVLQTIMDCDKLLTTLPNVRWAEPVFRLVSNLLDASMKYLTDNYAGILGNENFQNLDRELTWNISRLEDHLLAAAERLPPEQACKAYSKLDKLFDFTHTEETQHTTKWSPLFSSLMNKIRGQVEKCLVRDAARAARTNAWLKMDLELRRRIQELACLVILPNEGPNKRPSRHSNFLKEPKERQEVKMPTNRAPPNKNLIDLRKIKVAISEHNDKTLRQTPLLQTRKIMNKPKTDPLERKLQNEKLSNDIIIRPKSSKTEVKSRYLEPRNRPVTKESVQQINQEKTLGQQRRKIMISSSDSSRTSSPAMKRAAERKAISKISKVPVKKDGRALSSDSLTESNSRLNMKKEVASKSLGITRPESPLLKIAKDIEAGLSIDSLADPKKKTLIKKTGKMDTSMSTDSLMTDTTTITTPKSMTTNKSSPILGKTNSNLSQTRIYDKFKKSSPPTQQRSSNISVTTPTAMRRPARSLESSTAASRSRAAAVVNTYGSLNLRKSLLDAAKAPDIPNRALNSPAMTRSTLRQSYSMRSSFAISKNDKSDKKDESTNNQRTSTSPLSKRSPKSNVNSRLSKSNIVSNKQKANNKPDDKSSNKTKSQTTGNQDGPKFLNQSSRSGTFLKDEPTILKKSDIETAAIDV